MNEAEDKFIWIMLNEAGGRRSQPCFHYAEHEDFGDSVAGSTIRISESNGKPTMNEAEAKFIWIMQNEAGGRRSQPCFHYAEREDFGGCAADSTIRISDSKS